MSWEAWGTPPDEEQELCPICDNTQHTPDKCEVAASEAHSRTYYEGVLELWRADQERKLTNAYAEGRKDQAEESFKAGWLDCRATMARFVEPNSPVIAMSIRANWKPSLGDDPERSEAQSGDGSPLGSGARPDQPKLNAPGSSIGLGAEGEQ